MEIITTPGPEGFIKAIEWNHEELKAEMQEKVAMYGAIVYDDDQIKAAKADRAELNKMVKALEDKRKEIKSQCLAPYEKFEKQMKELVAIVQQPIALIDEQVKAYEAKQKEAKMEEIKAYIATKDLKGIEPAAIANPKWMNATTSMKQIQEEIDKKAEEIAADMAILEDLAEYSFEAIETYKNTLDVRAGINKAKELQEIAKRKAEWEAAQKAQEEAQAAALEQVKAEEEKAPELAPDEATEAFIPNFEEQEDFMPDFDSIPDARHWVTIKAFMTPDQQQALEEYMVGLGVPYETL